jgi:hypothetical protein
VRTWAIGTMVATVSLLAGSSMAADAEPLAARDTAAVLPPGAWSIGLFDPLRIGIRKDIEITTHPIFDVLLSPNAALRVLWAGGSRLRLLGEYGLSIPTMAMRWLGQGYVFPSWDDDGGRVGWFVVPSAAAVVASGDVGVWTARVETAVGIPIGPNEATLPESWAPLDLVFAPALTGLRTRVGAAYDHPLASWLRLRVAVDGWMVGKTFEPPRDSLYESAQITFDIRLGPHGRLVLGGSVFDSDQHRTEVICSPRCRRERVRSVDFFPVVDFVWRR